jgi:hypothetical protein
VTDLAQAGRGIVDAALYMVLATSDRSGRPWPAPVYFAHRDYRELIWVSKPEATHSRNLEARPEVGTREGRLAVRLARGVADEHGDAPVLDPEAAGVVVVADVVAVDRPGDRLRLPRREPGLPVGNALGDG